MRYNNKLLLALGLFAKAASCLGFGLLKSKWAMLLAKLSMGSSEALIGLWATVWVEANAPKENKALWQGCAGTSAGIGSGTGAAIAGFCSASMGYAFAFQVQSVVLFTLWGIMIFTPPRFFEFIEAAAKAPPTPKPDLFDPSISNTWMEESRNEPDARPNRLRRTTSTDSKLMLQQEIARTMSIEARLRNNTATTWTEVDDIITEEEEEDTVDNDVSFCDNFRMVLSSRLWLFTALSISLNNFVTNAVAFMWQNTTESVWHFSDKEATWSFMITTGLGGAVGVALGPKLFDEYLQGFADKQGKMTCLRWCTKLMVAAVAFGSIVAVLCLDTTWHILHYEVAHQVRGWLLALILVGVFCVFSLLNSTMGTLYGINTDSITPETKTFAAGLTLCMQNVIGFACGPLLPSLTAEFVGHCIRDAWEESDGVVHSAQFSVGMAVSLLASWPLLLTVRLAAVAAGVGQQGTSSASIVQVHVPGRPTARREEAMPFMRADAPALLLDPL